MTALIRNLATMTRVGLLDLARPQRPRWSRSSATWIASGAHACTRSRCSRRSGRTRRVGARGRNEWRPVRRIVDALDAAFYAAFGNVTPTGKRLLLALDVSGSMESGWVAASWPLASGRVGRARTRPRPSRTTRSSASTRVEEAGRRAAAASTTSARTASPLSISPRQRLDDAVKAVSDLLFGGTDCALPMLYAQATDKAIDTFVIFTDSETWAGNVHGRAPRLPPRVGHRRSAGRGRDGLERVLDRRPDRSGDARRRGFTATPQLISDFARGVV